MLAQLKKVYLRYPTITFNQTKNLFSNIRSLSLLQSIIVAQLLITSISSAIMYFNFKAETQNILNTQVNIIDNQLNSTIEQTTEFLTFIGNQISKGDYSDPKFILSTLRDINFSSHDLNINAFSWSFIDWVNPEGFQLVNQKEGIHHPPVDMNSRSYTKSCKKMPWKLHLSNPTIGFPSNTLVVPAGIGITNADKKFIGSLVVGFNIQELNKAIVEKLHQDVSFFVLNRSWDAIYHSKNLDLNLYYITFKNAQYKTLTPIADTQHFIVVMFDQQVINNTLLEYFSIILLINIIITSAVHGAIKYTRNKTLNITRFSESAANKLRTKINQNITDRATNINNAGRSLLNTIINDTQIADAQVKDLFCAIDIKSNLTNPLPQQVNYEKINLNQIIKESLDIKASTLLEKDITVTLNLQDNLPSIHSDKLCTELMIVGFLSYAIDSIAKERTIKIASSLTTTNTRKFISIDIIDSGLGIDLKDIERINSKTGTINNPFNSSLKYLLQLAKTMNCIHNIESTLGVGTKTNLLFPIESKKPEEDKLLSSTSNVIPFKPRHK